MDSSNFPTNKITGAQNFNFAFEFYQNCFIPKYNNFGRKFSDRFSNNFPTVQFFLGWGIALLLPHHKARARCIYEMKKMRPGQFLSSEYGQTSTS